MKVFGLIGKSGTGKSFQAVNLCKEMNIESIIDDGLFICRNKIAAGISAKRQSTKIGAVRTALFFKDDHCNEVKAAIGRIKPSSILVLGTSDEMVDKIVKRLELPRIIKRIYIEEITTDEDREIARKQRKDMGKHVIPVPTFQLKRQFSGYFMSPMRLVRELGPGKGLWKDVSEKSVVRPTYSYLGEYKISEKVMSDIVQCVSLGCGAIGDVGRVLAIPSQEGVDVSVSINMKQGCRLFSEAKSFQREVAEKIEEMTALNVNKLDIEIKDIEW